MENSNLIESSPDLVVSEENTSIGDLLNLYLTALFNGNVTALFNGLRMSIDSTKRNGSEVWQGLENHIGRLQLYIACFFADAGIAIDTTGADGQQMAIPTTPRPKGIETVRYVAANFRGLYQTNGRQTLIGLSGGLLRKAPDVEAHKTLHELYMSKLAHKSESVNQLFLANTRLSALSVHFVDQNLGFVAGAVSTTSGMIHKTTDGGSTWVTTQNVVNKALRGISFGSATNGAAVGASRAVKPLPRPPIRAPKSPKARRRRRKPGRAG